MVSDSALYSIVVASMCALSDPFSATPTDDTTCACLPFKNTIQVARRQASQRISGWAARRCSQGRYELGSNGHRVSGNRRPRRPRRGLGCLRSTSAPTKDPLQGRTTRPRARRSSSRAPPHPPPTPPTPQPRPTPRGPRKPHHPTACPNRSPLADAHAQPHHSPHEACWAAPSRN